MLLDANLLIYAIHEESPHHAAAKRWLEDVLSSGARVALPGQTAAAFLRLTTNPRIFAPPLTAAQAWSCLQSWLAVDTVWVPEAGRRTVEFLGQIMRSDPGIVADLVPDAMLAALALEHGLTIQTTDTDFGRLPCPWRNPLA